MSKCQEKPVWWRGVLKIADFSITRLSRNVRFETEDCKKGWGFHGCSGLLGGLDSEKSLLHGYLNLIKFYSDNP